MDKETQRLFAAFIADNTPEQYVVDHAVRGHSCPDDLCPACQGEPDAVAEVVRINTDRRRNMF